MLADTSDTSTLGLEDDEGFDMSVEDVAASAVADAIGIAVGRFATPPMQPMAMAAPPLGT